VLSRTTAAVRSPGFSRNRVEPNHPKATKPTSPTTTVALTDTGHDPTGFRAGSQANDYTGLTIKPFNLTPNFQL
jgi:hypothetical protein